MAGISIFSYDAFISYTHRSSIDWKISRWLSRKISRFVIPSKYRKRDIDGKPIKRFRVFRDSEDISGGKLTDTLKEKINKSENLILIASQSLKGTEWVEREVDEFLNRAGEDTTGPADGTIFPVLVDGINTDDSFPDSFNRVKNKNHYLILSVVSPRTGTESDEQIKEIDKDHDYGRKNCLYKILTALTGMERRDLERRIFWLTIRNWAFFLGIFFFILFLWYLYTMPKYEYYANYNDCFGIPKGVMSLTKEQVSHRYTTWRFEKRRIPIGEPGALHWRLSKIENINSSGVVVDIDATTPIIDLEYAKSNGALIGMVYRNADGKVERRSQITSNEEQQAVFEDFQNVYEGQGIDFIGFSNTIIMGLYFSGIGDAGSTSITRYAYERDQRGYITKITYHANNDYLLQRSAVCDEQGVWGISYDLDEFGNPLIERYLGRDGLETSNKNGVAQIRYTYDKDGLVSSWSFYDVNGNPTMLLQEHKYVLNRDMYGNIIEEFSYDLDGNPCNNNDWYSKAIWSYDKNGNLLSVDHYDFEGNSFYKKYYAPTIRYEYDSKGRMVAQSFYSDGRPVSSSQGYHRLEKKYNEKGQEVESRSYNEEGIIIEGQNYKQEFDEQGNNIRQSFIDGEGNIVINASINAAVIENLYDIKGNNVGQRFFDENYQLTWNKEGFAQSKFTLDERGNVIRSEYLDKEGDLIFIPKSYAAACEVDYDEKGRVIHIRYYDEKGQPSYGADEVFEERRSYDEYGNVVEESFYDKDGNLTPVSDNYYCVVQFEYDPRRNCTKVSFFDQNRKLCCARADFDYNAMLMSYDNNNRMSQVKYVLYDNKGVGYKLTRSVRCQHDSRGFISYFEYVDENNKPMANQYGELGFSMEYDHCGRIIHQVSYSSADRKSISLDLIIVYDENGSVNKVVLEDYYNNQKYTIDGSEIANFQYGDMGYIEGVDIKN